MDLSCVKDELQFEEVTIKPEPTDRYDFEGPDTHDIPDLVKREIYEEDTEVESNEKVVQAEINTEEEYATKPREYDKKVKDEDLSFELAEVQRRFKEITREPNFDLSQPDGDKLWTCNVCHYRTSSRNQLKRHLFSHIQLRRLCFYKCDECSFKAQNKRDLDRHERLHMLEANRQESDIIKESNCENKLKQCPECMYKTNTISSLNRHLEVHKSVSELTLLSCDLCDYKTRQRGHLTRHSIVHKKLEEIKMHRCDQCTFLTKQKYTLRRHILNVHDKKKLNNVRSEGLYICNECFYKTTRRSDLISHMVLHRSPEDVTLFHCEECEFKTKYKRNLAKHMTKHKESKELLVYECSKCSFKTKLRYNLKRHYLSRKHLEMRRAPRGSLKGEKLEIEDCDI